MAKPKSQLDPKIKKLFTETEVGALLEDIDSKLGVVVESQTALLKSHNKLTERVDVLVDTVGEMKVDLNEMKIELTEVNGKLDRKADRSAVEQLDRRVAILEVK